MHRLIPILLFLAAAVRAENPLLTEERIWKGRIELESVSEEPAGGEGRERQNEWLEFTLITQPPRTTVGWARLLFGMREVSGGYTLGVDTKEGEGREALHAQGSGEGRLHGRVHGYVEPERRRYRLRFDAAPRNLVARTTMTGMSHGRFTTWRIVTSRRPMLHGFEVEAEAPEGVALLEGERTFVDRRLRLRRQVTVRWKVARIDPVIAGRVVDAAGSPLAGLKVLARTTNPGRIRSRLPPLLREGTTDAAGRFRIEAFWAHWNVQVVGTERDGRVVSGVAVEEGVRLTRDKVPELNLRADVYRLERLPWARLLRGHFRGDVDAYLRHVRERVPAAHLKAALADAPD